MSRTCFFTVLLFLVSVTTAASAEGDAGTNEVKVTPKTEAVALFKNGYTVIRQEIEVPGPGVYRWEEVPAVIHGSFFIESDLNVEVRTTQRIVTLPVDAKNPPRLATDLVGKLVNVHFFTPQGDKDRTATGRILDTAPATEPNSLLPELARSTARPRYDYFGSSYYPSSVVTPLTATQALGTPIVLESPEGNRYSFLTGQQITYIETLEPVKERLERRPVMIFHATKRDADSGGKIRLFYLTKGATWAPSYRVDLLDGKRLRIEQAAAIRNEGSALFDTDISLVSGFPQIECSQILSPITPSQTLEQFFRQIIAQSEQSRRRSFSGNEMSFMGNSAMSQMAVHPSATANAGFDTTALAAGEGPDIHYNAIGRRTLETGDTLSLTVGKGEAEYRRLLECDLTPQVLNFYEQSRYNWRNQNAGDRLITPEVFDVLKFPNPLAFPMTTAPAMVTENARFLGQSQSGWVNPGQVASVKITKVMNISVTYSEKAQDVQPQEVQKFRGNNFIKRTVTGTIEIVNRRNEEITLHLNGLLLGKAEQIEPAPTKQMLSAKDYWPNDLTDLFWERTLKPGESQTITVSGTRWFHF